jgi:uncharacterized delta-60 repeat protein
MAVDAQGRIVVGADVFDFVAGNSTPADFAAGRLTPTGAPDVTFAGDGTATLDVGGSELATALVVQQDGKVVVGGRVRNNTTGVIDTAMVRFTATGTPDATFDGDGIYQQSLVNTFSPDQITDMVLQDDGKLLAIAGWGTDWRIARFHLGVQTFTLTSADTLDVLDDEGTNRPPVAAGQSFTTPEDTPRSGNLTATDPDGNPLTYSVVAPPAHGTLSVTAATGAFTYTPALNYNGPDSFTFKANDGTADSNVATVTVTVTAVNDAPVASGWQFGTNEDTPLVETLRASDVEGDPLTFTILAQPTQGSVRLTNQNTGEFIFTPAPDFTGTVSFDFLVNDGTVDSSPARVFVTVVPVNDPPVAVDDSAAASEDSPPVELDVLANDSDVDGGGLTITGVTQPANGQVAVTGGGAAVTYQPAPNFHGTDTFTYTVSDGRGGSATATVTVTVTPVNDAPVADPASVTTDEDSPLTGLLSGVDVDGDPLTFEAVTGPAHGAVTVNADGTFTYTPALNYNGPDSFTFKVSDGTTESAPAEVSVTVRAVNDAPTVTGGPFAVPENSAAGTAVGTVTGADVEGDTLTYSITVGNAGGAFAISPTTGAITVARSEALDFETTPDFDLTVQVRDTGGLVGTAVVRVTLLDVPEASPVVIDIKPGDARNRINPKSNGKIEVAILSTAAFDARSVDVGSLRFGRTGTEDSISTHPNKGPRYSFVDVNGDGRLDLVVQFETERTGFRAGDTKGILTGRLLSGASFTAEDLITTE